MLILDRVGLGHFTYGSGWVGSRKLDPRPTLVLLEIPGYLEGALKRDNSSGSRAGGSNLCKQDVDDGKMYT